MNKQETHFNQANTHGYTDEQLDTANRMVGSVREDWPEEEAHYYDFTCERALRAVECDEGSRWTEFREMMNR